MIVIMQPCHQKPKIKKRTLKSTSSVPGSPLTIVIYKKDRASFSYTPETFLPGKNICVSGTVKIYKGKPEIIITRPDEV